MTPARILETLWGQGLTVTLGNGDRLVVSPASALRDSQRELLRANKAPIVVFLRESNDAASDLMTALLAAAMRVCDDHGDGPAARADMERDCLATPPHLRRDLLEHFQSVHPDIAEDQE